MRPKRTTFLLVLFGLALALGVVGGQVYYKNHVNDPVSAGPEEHVASPTPAASPVSLTSPSPAPSDTPAMNGPAQASNPNPDLSVDSNGLSVATVVLTTSQGLVRMKLFATDAPQTVKRFVELIQSGFYNGKVFHKVHAGFDIQGGSPDGSENGVTGHPIKAEFNHRRHVEGTVGMARGPDPDSADCQFYVTLAPEPQLDGSYTVFGQVIDGMDVIRKIKPGDKMLSVVIQ